MQMNYYLYKMYSPFTEREKQRALEHFPYLPVYQAYAKTDPFTHSARKFIGELEKSKPSETLDDLIDMKLHIAKSKVELILVQLEEMRNQKEYCLKGITYDQLKIGNLIHSLKPQIYKDYRRLFNFYEKKLDLYREARNQEL